MLFNSLRYIVFLTVVVALFWRLPTRHRPLLLLVGSYLFYMNWFPQYGLMIVTLTTLNYFLGLRLASARSQRRVWLWLGVVFNLGVLAFFKYTNFILDNVRAIADMAGQTFSLDASILLPLGISFFTFEFIHYLVDVYRGSPPVRSWVDFALFPAFFPTQIAGPIKRYQNFIPQLSLPTVFGSDRFQDGLRLIVRGLFKKVVLADNLVAVVEAGFGAPSGLGAVDAWLVVLAFTLQIYFDFSGYTDIGRGSAALLGYDVPENFNLPYLAENLADFWRRWHISLSSWLRDYLYIPLGGSRRGLARQYFNLFATMTLGGLWHGAAWTFVVWGAFHGLGLIVHREWQRHTTRWAGARQSLVWRGLAGALTLMFVAVGWVFFRATTLGVAAELLQRMTLIGAPRWIGSLDPDHWLTTAIVAGAYGLYLAAAEWARRTPPPAWLRTRAWMVRAAVMALMVLAIVAFPGGQASFIYFQF